MLHASPGTKCCLPLLIKELGWYWRSTVDTREPFHYAALPTSCRLDLTVLPSPSLHCLCCLVSSCSSLAGSQQVRKAAVLLQLLCLVAASHEPSHPSKHQVGHLGLPRGFRGFAWADLAALPAFAGFGFGNCRCSGAPRCRPVSSAQCHAALLTPLSVLSVSLQPLLGKACL